MVSCTLIGKICEPRRYHRKNQLKRETPILDATGKTKFWSDRWVLFPYAVCTDNTVQFVNRTAMRSLTVVTCTAMAPFTAMMRTAMIASSGLVISNIFKGVPRKPLLIVLGLESYRDDPIPLSCCNIVPRLFFVFFLKGVPRKPFIRAGRLSWYL